MKGSGGVEAFKYELERPHNPVKHFALSRRRSRVQIPAGAFKIDDNVKKIAIKDELISNSATSKQSLSSKVQVKDFSNITLPNSVRNNQSQDLWTDFKSYLIAQNQSKRSIKDKLCYARRFYYVLENKDARPLLTLSYNSKAHTMKALASLSKYLGNYDIWLDIVKKFQLKWAESNKSVKVFKSIFDSEGNGESLDKMICWIKDVNKILPQEYKNVLLFNTLTGLRPDEAQKAIYLIKTMENEYVDRDKGVLKHYQFPINFCGKQKMHISALLMRYFRYGKAYSK